VSVTIKGKEGWKEKKWRYEGNESKMKEIVNHSRSQRWGKLR
jgi:hypothetical protein